MLENLLALEDFGSPRLFVLYPVSIPLLDDIFVKVRSGIGVARKALIAS